MSRSGSRRLWATFARHFAAPAMGLVAVLAAFASGSGQERAPGAYEVDGRKSGYLFLGDDTRALQDDDFLNPGMFAVEQGRLIWDLVDGTAGLSCASCHRDPETTMKGVAARYPQYDPNLGRLVNLELRINHERTERMKAEPYRYESEELLALTAFVSFQSRGIPMAVDIEGPAKAYFERGREFYMTRRGQLDLACAQCHDELAGSKLRGDIISQGQANGFPFYRLMWNSTASRHRMFVWCNSSIRAEPFALGSEEYLSLELYVAWRGRGLPMEAPAVRR
jgi:sulfur-oxidizing protein SoxA